MKSTPDRKLLRSDSTIDQRTFDRHRREVGIDAQDAESIWSDVLSLGEQFRKNIADAMLGVSMQPRRGEILVVRSERTQETRAVSYRARRHERPNVALPHDDVAAGLPRENERRSLSTARHARHSRAHFPSPVQEKLTPNQKLAAGGFMTNLGREYKLLARREERAAMHKKSEKNRRKAQPATDDIQF